jgi:erythromycin esterase-like protein
VILIDDGLATGASMRAAVAALRQGQPGRIVVAVPIAAHSTCEEFQDEVDEVVCARTPEPFYAVGLWYEDFTQTTDEEVRELLRRARRPPEPSAPADPRPLTGDAADYDPLVERAAERRYVLLGEASHGTHEFYRERAEITKRLVAEAGYTAVAVEADWPDAYRVNRFVRGVGGDADAEEALGDFARFPVWMWRNTEVMAFLTWLREWNDALPDGAPRVGFYGLDLYSLHTSMDEVVRFLEGIDPAAAQRARERYACFDHFSRDPQVYGYETGLGGAEPCEQEAVEQLVDLRNMAADLATSNGHLDDGHFYAERNARLVVDAEEYYRQAFRGGVESWNLRDQHMAETLEALVAHLERTAGPTKAVVWEHNSHIGDARATELGQAGELNVGQLVRERVGRDSLLLGFTTYTGTVTAASDWGGPAENKRVRPALGGSWEDLLHQTGAGRFLIVDTVGLGARRLERAIGVVYRPETERISHYFHARLAPQFDAVIHIDETSAVEPLDRTSAREPAELPETYPFGV